MFHTILISLLLISNLVSIPPKDIVDQILEIAKKETLTQEDCKKVIKLANSNIIELDKFLIEKDFIYDFKMELLDAIYTDAYNLFDDTTYLAEKEKIYKWAQHSYPEESREHRVADSRSVEVYALWGKYDKAIDQLEKNIAVSKTPSLDHATCIYTKAWLQQQMGKTDVAIKTMHDSLEEYRFLIKIATETLKERTLSQSDIIRLKRGIEEANQGIDDSLEFLKNVE